MSADGVGEVLDFMPVLTGRPTNRHRIVRQIRVNRGTMKFAMDLQPRFDYARAAAHHRGVRRRRDLPVRRSRADPAHRRRAAAAPAPRCGGTAAGSAPPGPCARARAAGVVLESMGGAPAAADPRRSWTGCPATRPRSGATGSAEVHLHRPLAGDGGPLGDDPQAADLRPDRRAHRRGHGRPARAGRRRAELGLPLHLDPGRLVLGLRPARASATARRRPPSASGCGTGPPSRPGTAPAR